MKTVISITKPPRHNPLFTAGGDKSGGRPLKNGGLPVSRYEGQAGSGPAPVPVAGPRAVSAPHLVL